MITCRHESRRSIQLSVSHFILLQLHFKRSSNDLDALSRRLSLAERPSLLRWHDWSSDQESNVSPNPCMPSCVSSSCLLWTIDSCRAKRRGLSWGRENACSRAIKTWLEPPCSRFEQVGKRRPGPANTNMHGFKEGGVETGRVAFQKMSTLASRCAVSCITWYVMQQRVRKRQNKTKTFLLRNDYYRWCQTELHQLFIHRNGHEMLQYTGTAMFASIYPSIDWSIYLSIWFD